VNPRALGLLALAQVAIGAAAIFARFALAGGGAISASAFRLAIGALPVVVVAVARHAYTRHDARTEGRLAVAGVMLAAHFALWISSLRFASVAVSTLLVCSTPIWTELWDVVRLRRFRADVAISLVLGIAGVAIVIGAPAPGDLPLGIFLALGGALAFAAYLVLVRDADARYDTLAIVGRTYPLAALVLAGATLVTHDPIPPPGDLSAWGGIVAMALVSQLFGHTALNAAVRHLSPTFVATVTLIEPVIAGVLAALIFGERLTPATFAGSVAIFAAIGIALRAEGRLRAA
jgi:drug/metabolite transporter (DMT)-like permease